VFYSPLDPGDRWEDDDWIKDCKAAYAETCAVNFDSKKIGLCKSNMMKMCYGFWWRNFSPMRMSLLSVMVFMIHSGVYIPAATLLATAQGGVCRRQAEAMWLTICFPLDVTKRLMRNVYFSERTRNDNFISHYNDWCKPKGQEGESSGIYDVHLAA
jgi:hypothetical protein